MQPNLFDPKPDYQPEKPNVEIEESWKKVLQEDFQKSYFKEIKSFLKTEKAEGKTIYPPGSLIFNAFNQTPFDNVKVVILGQDPYHGPEQAHGLCFSVRNGVKPPPSLINIYKEIESDLGIRMPREKGNLLPWAQQGVFLLNAFLTVRKKQPASHRDIGWEKFTDTVISKISEQKKDVVFLLWGRFAQGKKAVIDGSSHLILDAPHPSPFSANSGFFGCHHFSKANKYLQAKGKEPINWQL